ncbi:hypothetical protein [Hymenobacter metallicola]|uniref:Uncharacterized protein n=1 Tax=Hymenobacter metallicola TaxID=2563114 RepID=A0A4Z0QAB2_9BACT|nr:hypothetical protein [Hymenobacter metallicola]TGE26998.1 hypothetical protein E5K02_11370 [Hymenobacter metallicola]
MTYENFVASLSATQPPAGLSSVLRGLWHAGRQEWDLAHTVAQDHDYDPMHNWLHAYLHRQEADLANAAYWYRRAGRSVATGPLPDEWMQLVKAQPDIESEAKSGT